MSQVLGFEGDGWRDGAPNDAVLDVPQEWTAELLDELEAPGQIRKVSAHGNRAALSLTDGRLAVVDVSDPFDMVLGQVLDFGNPNPLPVTACDGFAVAVYDDLGLWIMDWTDPTDVRVVGSHIPPYQLESVVVQDDLAFVAASDYGLLIYDISDRTSPTIVGSWEIDDDREPLVLSVFVDGDIALLNWGFWAWWDYNFYYMTHVLDVSDVAAPVHTAEISGTRYGCLRGTLFTTSITGYGGPGLRVTSLDDVYNPETVGSVPFNQDFDIIWGFNGPYLYVGNPSSSVTVVNLADPSSPTQEAIAEIPNSQSPGVVDGVLYVAHQSTFRTFSLYTEPPVVIDDPGTDGLPPVAPNWDLSCSPNPFNPRTTIALDVPMAGHARVRVFDARGREVDTIFDGPVESGRLEILWAGRDKSGRSVASGTYLVRANTCMRELVLPITLVR